MLSLWPEMFDGKYPVVSLKRGAAAAAKDVKESLEWLESFEKVVICFDNDAAGKQSLERGDVDLLTGESQGGIPST